MVLSFHTFKVLKASKHVRYFEDLFARDANAATVVNVASKAYRGVCLVYPSLFKINLSFVARSSKGPEISRST